MPTRRRSRVVVPASSPDDARVDTSTVSVAGVTVVTAEEFYAVVQTLAPDVHATSLGQVATSLLDGKVAHIAARGGENDVSRFSWHVSRGILPGIGKKTSKTVTVFGATAADGTRVVLAIGVHLRFAKGRHVYSLVWRDPRDAAAGNPSTFTIRVST